MTAHSNNGLLYTISEGAQGESPPVSPQSSGSITSVQEKEKEAKAKTPTETPDNRSKHKTCNNTKNGLSSKGKIHPRLEQLRGHVKMQIKENSPRNQMMDLVDKVTYEHEIAKNHTDGNRSNGAVENVKLNQCCGSTCSALEMEGKLQGEISALRLEMKSSLEALRSELGQEMRALQRNGKVCCHHCPPKEDHSRATEKRAEWKSVFRKVKSKEEQEVRSPVRLDGQIKARSVPSLVPPPGPSRNQVLLRAMSTIAAKNALMSSIGARSESDPGQLPYGKQYSKSALKNHESTDNWGRKINNRAVAPLSENGAPLAKAH